MKRLLAILIIGLGVGGFSVSSQAAMSDLIVNGSFRLECAVFDSVNLTCTYSQSGQVVDWKEVFAAGSFTSVLFQTRTATFPKVVCAGDFVPFSVATECWNITLSGQNIAMTSMGVQTDTDGDVLMNTYDNCPSVANSNQLNTDGDSQGDACDTDDDNDGVDDSNDAFPNDPGGVSDSDGDGMPDTIVGGFLLDGFESGDFSKNPWTDQNGQPTDWTVVAAGNRGAYSAKQKYQGSNALSLTKTFSVPTTLTFYYKNNPYAPHNVYYYPYFNIDGMPSAQLYANSWFMKSVVIAAGTHTLSWTVRCEGYGSDYGCTGLSLDDISTTTLMADNCPAVANIDQLNTDGDYQGNACDTDDDNDGIEDAADKFPLDPTETLDTDNDGIGNNADIDDDSDGIPDTWESQLGFNPLVNDASGDLDNDGITNYQEYLYASTPGAVLHVKKDYNDDGRAGWIWMGVSNGNETLSQNWQLTFPLHSANWSVPTRFYHPVFPDQANWEIVTSGDFDNDRDFDILWRNKNTADWKVWQMQGGARYAQNTWADSELGHEWNVVGAGDTDGDLDDDVILANTATGEVIIWTAQNNTLAEKYNIGAKVGYTLNRVGDFNGDGDVDLLLRGTGTDTLVIWEIQNNALVQERTFPNTGAGYNPVCAADFDGDGDDDIMLINSTTQQEKWFVLQNYARVSQQFGGTNVGFSFLGCGDYDGDGDNDTLWKRDSDELTRVVLQANWGNSKQTVYTNAFGGANGFVYRGNSN